MMHNRSNAYKEVYTILQELEESEYNKIPSEIINAIKNNMNEEYEFELDESLELKERALLPETKAILFNLFRDYLATPEQKEKIIKMQNEERHKLEAKKRQNYNTDIFTNTAQKKKQTTDNEVSLVTYNKTIFEKILNKIKTIFNKK